MEKLLGFFHNKLQLIADEGVELVINSPTVERLRCNKFFLVRNVCSLQEVKLGIVVSVLKNL